jgi:hypothetical protein
MAAFKFNFNWGNGKVGWVGMTVTLFLARNFLVKKEE